ncbi:MAG: ATP-binding cassette domain-containing protein [Dehalococcoidia bacterium]|nr:ATP-binding cassette domain-containing protein [Dehalococcoidia bacterium]
MTQQNSPLLEAKHLQKFFPAGQGLLPTKQRHWVKAVDDVSFRVESGKTLGIVGESGCGKTTLAKLVLLLEQPTAGTIHFQGEDVLKLRGDRLKHYRASVQAVFQDPYGAMDPRQRVGDMISEPLRVTRGVTNAEADQRVAEVLQQVGLSATAARYYPHEFSGGQRQRIAIARALSTQSQLLVLDEPVAALDVSIRSQILNLLKDLQESKGLGYILITHDLAVSKHLSHHVAVMYLGKIVELANSDSLYDRPNHPYTKALLSAALPTHPDETQEEIILSGEVPSPLDPPSGCRFRTRCPYVMPRCAESEPPLAEIAPGHLSACFLNN